MKLFIATPIHHAPEWEFQRSCMQLMAAPPCPLTFRALTGDSLVCRARNKLAALFLESDFTHLLFVDSDISFEPADVASLVASDKAVVGGFYPKKKVGPPEWVAIEGDGETEANLRSLRCIGTGFLMIARDVFAQLISEHGYDIEYQEEDGSDVWDFFPVGVQRYPDGTRRYLSEDYLFCERWRALGGKVWGHTGVTLQHVGRAVFPVAA